MIEATIQSLRGAWAWVQMASRTAAIEFSSWIAWLQATPERKVLALGIVGTVLIALAFVLWRRASRPAGDRAFEAISRRAGLSRRDRRVLRTLAASMPGSSPMALLLSEGALRRAIKLPGTIEPTLSEAAIRRLGMKLGVSSPDAAVERWTLADADPHDEHNLFAPAIVSSHADHEPSGIR
jgi:hypothetical protein